eukprot:g966.t1
MHAAERAWAAGDDAAGSGGDHPGPQHKHTLTPGEGPNFLPVFLENLSRATLDAADIPESDERSTGLRYETGKDLLAAAVAEAQKEAKTTWKDNDNKRKTQAKKPRYSDLTTTDGVVRAWEEAPGPLNPYDGKPDPPTVKSDLAKVVYPYMQALEERAPKNKDVDGGQELSELIRKEHLAIAVLGKSYVENIARQFRAFNSIQLVSDHEQEHIAGSIASYAEDGTWTGPKEAFYDAQTGDRPEDTNPWGRKFRGELKKLVLMAAGGGDADGRGGGTENVERAQFRTFPQMGANLAKEMQMAAVAPNQNGFISRNKQKPARAETLSTESLINFANLFQIAAWMPKIQGPMVFYRFGKFNGFKARGHGGASAIWKGKRRVSAHFESVMAFFGKGEYEDNYDLDLKADDLLIFSLDAGKSIPGIMVGRAFNAFEKPSGNVMVGAGTNLLEVILPPGLTSELKFESEGWWGDYLFGESDDGAKKMNRKVMPHMPEMRGWDKWKGGSGKARVYELEGW